MSDIREFIVDELQKEYSIGADVDIDELDYIASGYINSLGIVQFVVTLEDEFGIEFTDEEMESDEFRKVGTLVKLIESKIG